MFKRYKYFIKPSFQLRYIGAIIVIISIITIISASTTYYSAMSLLGTKLAYVYPQGRLSILLKEVNTTMIYRILLLLPLMVLIAVFLSHRIAGPIYRIEKTLEEIGKGNFDIRIHLRKHDELKEIANAINKMVGNLNKLKIKKDKWSTSLIAFCII